MSLLKREQQTSQISEIFIYNGGTWSIGVKVNLSYIKLEI